MSKDSDDSMRSKRQIKRVLIVLSVVEFIVTALAVFQVVKR